MKILLVNPSNAFNGYHVPKLLRKMPFLSKHLNFSSGSLFPPLNLALMAAYVPPDMEVEIMDGCIEPIDYTREADLVGITALTGNIVTAYETADRFRARGTAVVMGGNHPTVLPQEALEHSDAVVVGEGDNVFPELLKDFQKGQMKKIYKDTGLPSMEGHPIPRRDLLKADQYLVPFTIQTSRGCPFDCYFCSVTAINGQKFRVRPVVDVINEIKASGTKKMFFVDDIINGHLKHAKELLRAMIPLKIQWGSQATINFGDDPELLRLARESGCRFLFIGLESFVSKDFRKLGGKHIKAERLMASLQHIREEGIAIWGAFIIGLESDTLESVHKTVKLAIEAQLDFAQFSIMTPLPGTQLHDQLDAAGRIYDRNWRNYSYGKLVFHPETMTHAEVEHAFTDSWRTFYKPWNIFKRHSIGSLFRSGGLLRKLLKIYGLRRLVIRQMILWGSNFGVHHALSYTFKNRPEPKTFPVKAAPQIEPQPQPVTE